MKKYSKWLMLVKKAIKKVMHEQSKIVTHVTQTRDRKKLVVEANYPTVGGPAAIQPLHFRGKMNS